MKFLKIGTFPRGREFQGSVLAPSLMAQIEAEHAPVNAIYVLS